MTRRWEVHVSTLPISLVTGREDTGRSTENENGCRPWSAPVTSLPHPGIPHHESVVTVARLRHWIGCDDQAGIARPGVIRDLGQTSQGACTIDGRTSRHAGNGISQVIRKRIEEHFGWCKTVGRIWQSAYRGIKRVDQHFKLTMLASNQTRIARIRESMPLGVERRAAPAQPLRGNASVGPLTSGASGTIRQRLNGQLHTKPI